MQWGLSWNIIILLLTMPRLGWLPSHNTPPGLQGFSTRASTQRASNAVRTVMEYHHPAAHCSQCLVSVGCLHITPHQTYKDSPHKGPVMQWGLSWNIIILLLTMPRLGWLPSHNIPPGLQGFSTQRASNAVRTVMEYHHPTAHNASSRLAAFT